MVLFNVSDWSAKFSGRGCPPTPPQKYVHTPRETVRFVVRMLSVSTVLHISSVQTRGCASPASRAQDSGNLLIELMGTYMHVEIF